jgi:hypothetical protein
MTMAASRRHIYLSELFMRIPLLDTQSFNGHTTIAPAKDMGAYQ